MLTSRHGSATRDEFWSITLMMLGIVLPLAAGVVVVLRWVS